MSGHQRATRDGLLVNRPRRASCSDARRSSARLCKIVCFTPRAPARAHTHRSPPYAATSGDTSDEHLKRLERPTRQTVRLRLRANSPSHGGSAVGRRTPPRPRCTARTGSLYTHYTLQRRIRAAGPPRVFRLPHRAARHRTSRALPVFHSDLPCFRARSPLIFVFTETPRPESVR